MIVRHVPRNNCCLFHTVVVLLNLIQGQHLRMDDAGSLGELKVMSRSPRHTAMWCLQFCNNNNGGHHKKWCTTKKEVQAAVHSGGQINGNIAAAVHCCHPVWDKPRGLPQSDGAGFVVGGGPEIVVLCNVQERPIHVYELLGSGGGDTASNDNTEETTMSGRGQGGGIRVPNHLINKQFCLCRMVTFGSPRYDSRVPLQILSADSRFLDVPPESVKENGNHFMAIFPVSAMREHVNAVCMGGSVDSSKQKRRVRNSAATTSGNSIDGHHCGGGIIAFSLEELDNGWPSCGEWFDDFNYSYASPLDGMGGN